MSIIYHHPTLIILALGTVSIAATWIWFLMSDKTEYPEWAEDEFWL